MVKRIIVQGDKKNTIYYYPTFERITDRTGLTQEQVEKSSRDGSILLDSRWLISHDMDLKPLGFKWGVIKYTSKNKKICKRSGFFLRIKEVIYCATIVSDGYNLSKIEVSNGIKSHKIGKFKTQDEFKSLI